MILLFWLLHDMWFMNYVKWDRGNGVIGINGIVAVNGVIGVIEINDISG